MPSGDPKAIPAVIELIWKLVPKSILDVGAGGGRYGALFRDYIENRLSDASGQMPEKRAARIDAVEGYEPYISDLHRAVYDDIFPMLIDDFIEKHGDRRYDIIYAGDVIEHIEKKHAVGNIIPRLLSMSRMGLLIAVPGDNHDQGAVFGNELEIHRSKWRPADFRSLAPHAHVGTFQRKLLAFLSNDRAPVAAVTNGRGKRRLRYILDAARSTW